MAYYINILTDNNRTGFHICLGDQMVSTTNNLNYSRLVYQEIHESETAAWSRLEELRCYTRMQTERIIRKNNPDWLDLSRRIYQPGAKLRPKVPTLTSFR